MTPSPMLMSNNGAEMPALGLGVFLSPPEVTAAAVEAAIASGYRMVDTAAAYLNERQVGEGIRASGIARDEIFVTTKLWPTQYGYDEALRAFEGSLSRLGLDRLDLYLLHWPVPTDFERTVASYRALERLLADGRVRAIGVCNCTPRHLEDLTARTDIPPAVNQIELNPYVTQRATREANARLGTVTQSWSPIGGAHTRNPSASPAEAATPIAHPVVARIGATHGRTPAQVVVRWHLDHGFSAIPKSVRPERIAQNGNVLDFSLTAEEIARIDALDTGQRAGAEPDSVTAGTWPVDVDAQ